MSLQPYEPLVVDTDSCITTILCPSAASAKTLVSVYNSYKHLPPAWDLLMPANHKLSTRNLAYIEESNISNVDYYYAVVNVNDTIAGVIYIHRLSVNNTHYPDFSNQGQIAKHLYNTVSKRNFGLLVAGNMFYTGVPSYWFDTNNIGAADFFKAMRQTLNKLLVTTKSHAVILKDVDPVLEQQLSQKSWGFAHMGDDIFMQMPLRPDWATFDDYTKSLSKKYAARVRKMTEVRNTLTIKQLTLSEIEHYLPEIERLYLEVCSHSSVKMGVLNGQYFLNMANALGNYFEVWGWFKDDRMIAFTTCVIQNGSYEVYYIGYAEEDNRQYCIYPNILLHGVERSINLKKTQLKLGRTALEAKAIVGCEPLYINNYIKLKSKPMQLGLKYMLKAFATERGTEWKKRSPFKS